MRFLNKLGIEPEDVRLEHATAYRDALVLNEINRSPEATRRNAVYAWNRAVRGLPFWRRQSLTLPSRSRRIRLPLEQFPESFRDDLERYVRTMERPDPFDDDAPSKALRPATIVQYHLRLWRFASVLALDGVPAVDIVDLGVLVAPAMAERGLRSMAARNGGQKSVDIAAMATLLQGLAKGYVKVSDADQRNIDRLAKRAAMRKARGMTEKNRERLRPLRDDAQLRELLLLPEKLFQRANRMADTHSAARLREDAVAIGILLCCPIRRHNLAQIELERNLSRPRDGRVYLNRAGFPGGCFV